MYNINHLQVMDERCNLVFPWYTKEFLNVLKDWDVSKWKVFEYGGGRSTLWWKHYAKEVVSVDNNQDCAKAYGCEFFDTKKEYVEHPLNFSENEKFDCIIIDGEPVAWRDDCTEIALKCLKKGGILIIDNYKQSSSGTPFWPITEKLLENYKENDFYHPGHDDWRTSYWKIG